MNSIFNRDNRISRPVYSKIVCLCVAVYFALSFYEFAFSTSAGSLLKFFGLAIMAVWAALAVIQHVLVRFNKFTMLLLAWLLANVLSMLWTPNRSVGSYYILASGNMICMLIVVRNLYWSKKAVKRLLLIYAVAAAVLSLLIIINGDLYHGEGIRYTFTLFGNEMDPNGIAAFLAPVILILVHFLMNDARLWFLYIAGIVVCMLASALAASRGGMIALLFSAVAYLVLDVKWNKKSVKGKAIKRLLLFFAAILAVYIISKYVSGEIISRLLGFESYVEDRGSERLDLWKAAMSYYLKSPVYGLGIAGYLALTSRGIHNMYLSVLCDAGFFSFIPFVGAIFVLLRSLIRKKEALAVSMLICIMILMFFLDTYQKKMMWNIFILSSVMLEAQSGAKQMQQPCRNQKNKSEIIGV